MEIMSDPESPVLKLDAKGLLDFIDLQNRKEREYFDRLLRWLAGGVAIIAAVLAFLGYQNSSQVRKIGDEIREETKQQLIAAVGAELTKDKVQDQITKAQQLRTEGPVSGRYQQSRRGGTEHPAAPTALGGCHPAASGPSDEAPARPGQDFIAR